MIEAYEKLRDQVLEMHLPGTQEHALQDMFDMWLRALYRVHEELAADRDRDANAESPQTVDLN